LEVGVREFLRRHPWLAAGAVLIIALLPMEVRAAAPESWEPAGVLGAGRSQHTATLLGDSTVLVAGGSSGSGRLASAEIYDPDLNSWSPTGALSTARNSHTATLLCDLNLPVCGDSRVLVVGGQDAGGNALASVELYDPATQVWSSMAPLAVARYGHSSIRLPSGKVLVTGGCCADAISRTSLASTEIWDPATGLWSRGPDLAGPRASHAIAPISNGTVIVVGGAWRAVSPVATAEIYEPALNAWRPTGGLSTARVFHTATRLIGDRILVTGGSAGGCCSGLASAELFMPDTERWHPVGNMTTARQAHAAAAIQDGGAAIVMGGYSCCSEPQPIRSSTEIFDYDLETFRLVGVMAQPRYAHTATTLDNGMVLAVGVVVSAERYQP
jgi:hypothetical protein